VDINNALDTKKRRIGYGMFCYHIDDGYFKKQVYTRIRWDKSLAGGWWIPQDVGEFYKRSVLSEELVIKPSGKQKWLVNFKDNHYLDCEKLILAGASIKRIEKLIDQQLGK
jgi:hypothetical protein